MRVRLGVLDQSPVISGHSPAEAIAETVSLAQLAEELGYHRYWLAEHHAIAVPRYSTEENELTSTWK